MSDLYGRKWSLIVSAGDKALDLSQMRIRFNITAADTDAPNTAVIRINNLNQDTVRALVKEYQRVTLQAGYQQGNFGIIFDGTIKQIIRGRETPTETFVEIRAAEADTMFNFAVVNQSLAAGASPKDQADAIAKETQKYDNVGLGQTPGLETTGGILPRGKVLFGLARDRLSDLAGSTQSTWSVQNGKIVVIPLTGYLPGQAVQLNARTGLVGIPEATVGGLNARALLNPFIRIGTRVQIDNQAINKTTVREQGFPKYTDLNFVADVTTDGFYRVLVAEHWGDNRGREWYTDLVCLAIDSSAAPEESVQAYG